MKVIVVTGGIASGKSTVVGLLKEFGEEGVECFDCDAAVAELQQTGRLSRDLVAAFGPDALDEKGQVNKEFLRELVQNDPERREELNHLIHPKLAEMFREAQAAARQRGDVHTFLLDIPLYYESPVVFGDDHTIVCVTAVSPETQVARLMKRDGIGKREAKAFIAAQMTTQEKIDRANVVFWNEGTPDYLKRQVELFYATELASEANAMHARHIVIDLNELRVKPLNELQRLAVAKGRKGSQSKPRRSWWQSWRAPISRRAARCSPAACWKLAGTMWPSCETPPAVSVPAWMTPWSPTAWCRNTACAPATA